MDRTTNKTAGRRRGRLRAVLVGTLAVVLGAAGFAVPASAATLDAITGVTVTWPSGSVIVGSSVRVDATWAVPDSATGGDTFSLGLPTSPRFDADAIAPFSITTPRV